MHYNTSLYINHQKRDLTPFKRQDSDQTAADSTHISDSQQGNEPGWSLKNPNLENWQGRPSVKFHQSQKTSAGASATHLFLCEGFSKACSGSFTAKRLGNTSFKNLINMFLLPLRNLQSLLVGEIPPLMLHGDQQWPFFLRFYILIFPPPTPALCSTWYFSIGNLIDFLEYSASWLPDLLAKSNPS